MHTLRIVIALLLLGACSRSEPTSKSSSATASVTAAPTASASRKLSTEWDPNWDALPPNAEAVADVRDIYAFAARHPEIVGYMPCFCGCSARGHKSVESCFVSARDNGQPRWNPMGAG